MIKRAERLNSVKEYYFSQKLKEVAVLKAQGKPIINMGIGSPDLAPHQKVLNALQISLTDEKAHEYQAYQGLPELRGAFGNFYKSIYHVDNKAIEFLPLIGSKEGIMHIAMTFLNADDEVLIPNPGYPAYASVTELVQAKPIFYNLIEKNNYQPDYEALEALDLSKVKLMWVNYPHMPTGALATLDTYQKLIDFGNRHNILIVNDNPYSLILNPQPLSIFQIDGADQIALELNSLSKSFNMAGWRVGVVAGQNIFLQDIIKVKSNMDSGMFYGIQKGAIEALNLDQSWHESLNNIYHKRRKLIFELASQLGLKYNEQTAGLFVWCKLPEGISSDKFVDDLLYNRDIFITPGHIFGSNGEGYVRFSLCVDEKMIEEAIERL